MQKMIRRAAQSLLFALAATSLTISSQTKLSAEITAESVNQCNAEVARSLFCSARLPRKPAPIL